MEPRLLMSTQEAPGGEAVWGSGNPSWYGDGQVVNGSSHVIYVYVGEKAAWIALPPGTHTPPSSDADAWTFDPSVIEGPRDPSGDPRARKVGNGHTAKAMDTADGKGVQHDAGGSSTTTVVYPEQMSGRHPKDLPPGHNGTPDTDLPDDEPGYSGEDGDFDKGNDFDDWYADPANGKTNPNGPGYKAPRPVVVEEPPGVLEDDDDDDSVLS